MISNAIKTLPRRSSPSFRLGLLYEGLNNAETEDMTNKADVVARTLDSWLKLATVENFAQYWDHCFFCKKKISARTLSYMDSEFE